MEENFWENHKVTVHLDKDLHGRVDIMLADNGSRVPIAIYD